MNFIDQLKYRYKNGNTLFRLIYINVGVFLVVALVSIFFQLFKINAVDLTKWFSMPSNLSQLAKYFWTPLTYMFYHEKFLHILFNMLVLFWFGQLFLMYYSEKQLFSLYILGGLSGAAFYLLGYNLIPYYEAAAYYSLLMGASGSILAILVASGVRAPNMEMRLLLLGPVKLKWIAIATVLISLFGLTSANAGGEIAHLGGALAGYLFVISERKGKDITLFITKIINFFVNLFQPKPKVVRPKFHAQKMSSEEYNQKKANDEKEIDRILDKIKTSGYESLTAEEKKLLFDQKR